MISSPRTAALRLLAVLAVVVGASACSQTDGHTYVDVDVNIDSTTIDANRQYLILSCELQVTGADEASEMLPCRENQVPLHVGTFQWSSAATSGALTFTVTVFGTNRVALGAGSSEPVGVSPGKRLQSSVLIVGVASPEDGGVTPDGGTPTDGAPADGATD